METGGSIIRRIRKTLSKRGCKATVQRDAELVPVESGKAEDAKGDKAVCKWVVVKEQDRGGARRQYVSGSPGTVHQERISELAQEKAELPVRNELPEVRY